MFSIFIKTNVLLAQWFESVIRYPPNSTGCLYPYEARSMFMAAKVIGDVGGGKKPYSIVANLSTGGKIYIGMDIDASELALAPEGVYSETAIVDICSPNISFKNRFDLIICRSTLEHVRNSEAAIAGLYTLLAPGGRCFVKVPCRRALFAQINLLLPNSVKKKLLHSIFPDKRGDGFPVFYDRSYPSAIRLIAKQQGMEVLAERRHYRSTYFSFLFPLYVFARLAATLQYLLDRDYCESFEVVLFKPVSAPKAS